MAENDGSIIIDIVLDYSKFEKSASEAEKSATTTGKAIEKSVNPDTKGLTQLTAKQEEARKSAVEYKTTLTSLSDMQKKINVLYKEQRIDVDSYERLTQEVQKTTETFKDNQKQIEQSDKLFAKSSESLEKVTQEYAKLLAEMDAIADKKMGEIADFYPDPNDLDAALAGLLETDKTYQKLSQSADLAEASISKYTAQMNEASNNSTTLSQSQEQLKESISQLDSQFPQMDHSLENLLQSFTRLVDRGIQIAVNALEDFAIDGLDYITNLETSTKSMETIFGDSASAVDNWSKSLVEAYGLSEGKAKDFATSLGLIFSQADLTDQEVAEMSTTLVGLSSDWASFTGMDVETVFNKLQGGLTGNIEGLRALGIDLSQATLDQYAFEEGLGDSFSALDSNEKMLVLYAAILEQSGVAMGDFAENSDELRNQQQKLEAQMDELKGTFAEQLLPALTNGITSLNSFLTDHGDTLGKLGGIIGDIINIFINLIDTITSIPTPVLQVIGVVLTLIAGFIKVSEVTDKVTGAFNVFNAGTGTTIAKIGLIVVAVVALSVAIAAVIGQLNVLMGKGAQAQNMMNSTNNLKNAGSKGYANGTNSAQSGWKLVGEQGPELINLRGGEQVFTAAQTYSLFAGMGNATEQTSSTLGNPSFYKTSEGSTYQDITNTYYFNVQGIEEMSALLDLLKKQDQRNVVGRR